MRERERESYRHSNTSEAQRVGLRRRNSATSPVGIYRCEIPTEAVHNDDDDLVRDAPVYVGLYTGSGGIILCSLKVHGCKSI